MWPSRPLFGQIGRRRRAGDDADLRGLEARVAQRIRGPRAVRPCVGGDIGCAVIGIVGCTMSSPSGDAHDDVAALRVERVADEAGRVGIERVGDDLAELVGEQFGDLVLEAFARLVGERQVARVGAGPKHMRIDELHRAFASRVLRARAASARATPSQREADEPKRETTALRRRHRPDSVECLAINRTHAFVFGGGERGAASAHVWPAGRARPRPVERARR